MEHPIENTKNEPQQPRSNSEAIMCNLKEGYANSSNKSLAKKGLGRRNWAKSEIMNQCHNHLFSEMILIDNPLCETIMRHQIPTNFIRPPYIELYLGDLDSHENLYEINKDSIIRGLIYVCKILANLQIFLILVYLNE